MTAYAVILHVSTSGLCCRGTLHQLLPLVRNSAEDMNARESGIFLHASGCAQGKQVFRDSTRQSSCLVRRLTDFLFSWTFQESCRLQDHLGCSLDSFLANEPAWASRHSTATDAISWTILRAGCLLARLSLYIRFDISALKRFII